MKECSMAGQQSWNQHYPLRTAQGECSPNEDLDAQTSIPEEREREREREREAQQQQTENILSITKEATTKGTTELGICC